MQNLNTRSHKGEKEKVPSKQPGSDHDHDDIDSASEANLSLMDKTKRHAKAAREQHRQRTDNLLSAEGEVLDLEEVLIQTRERVKATKAAHSRAEAIRRELQDLHEEEESVLALQQDVPDPVPDASDPSAFIAATLKSAVNISLYSMR